MDPVIVASVVIFTSFIRAALRAIVPLLAGAVAAIIAGGLFALLLRRADIADFFSAASAVGIGVLVALVVNGSLGAAADSLSQEARAGTIALTTIGILAALIGQLTTGSAIVRGASFATTWGGMTAGVLGLVYFVRTETPSPNADRAGELALASFREGAGSKLPPQSDKPG
jgi:hypothetical protein